jgi:hypothetical protein
MKKKQITGKDNMKRVKGKEQKQFDLGSIFGPADIIQDDHIHNIPSLLPLEQTTSKLILKPEEIKDEGHPLEKLIFGHRRTTSKKKRKYVDKYREII